VLIDGVATTAFTHSGNDIRTDVAVPNTSTVTIYRETPKIQTQPFPSNTTPAAEDVRAGFDKLTLIAQEQQEQLDRSIKSAIDTPFVNSSTIGLDSTGNFVSRTASEEATHLGIGASVAAAKVFADSAEEQSGFAHDERVLAEAAAAAAANYDGSSALKTDGSQTLTQTQKDNLAATWPEAVGGITDSELLALGYVKTVNGKIPASIIPGVTPSQILSDRMDYILIPLYGQSLAAANTSTNAITTTNPDSDIVSFSGGVKSLDAELTSFVAAVEDSTRIHVGTPEEAQSGETGLVLGAKEILDNADTLSATRGPKYVVQACGIGSARLDMLLKGAASGYYENYILPSITALGTVTTGLAKTSEMPIVVFRQGESGTSPDSKATYETQLEQLKDDLQGDGSANLTRQSPLKILSYQTGGFGGGGTRTYPAEVQFDFHRTKDWFLIGAPVYWIYGLSKATNNFYSTLDDIHLTSIGYALQGAREMRIGAKWLSTGTKPKTCTPENPVISGGVGSVDFDLETAPIVIDTTDVEAVTNYGIACEDATGVLTVSKVRVARFLTGDRNRIRWNVNRAVGASGEWRYGLDYNFPNSQVAGFGGNLRDSTAGTINLATATIPAADYGLYNPAPMAKLPLAADTDTDFPCDHFYALVDDVTSYEDLVGSSTITELDLTPVFTGQGNSVVINTDSELDTNITTSGSIESAYVLVYISPSYALSTSATATLLNTRNGTLSGANGVTVNIGKANLPGDPYNVTVSTWSADSTFQNDSILLDPAFVGWAMVGYSFDAVAGNVKAWCSPLAANSVTEVVGGGGHVAYTGAGTTLQIGRGSYTQSGSGLVNGSNIAAVGYANKYFSTADIAAVIAHAEAEFNITL
jgi:hypothetical protein